MGTKLCSVYIKKVKVNASSCLCIKAVYSHANCFPVNTRYYTYKECTYILLYHTAVLWQKKMLWPYSMLQRQNKTFHQSCTIVRTFTLRSCYYCASHTATLVFRFVNSHCHSCKWSIYIYKGSTPQPLSGLIKVGEYLKDNLPWKALWEAVAKSNARCETAKISAYYRHC